DVTIADEDGDTPLHLASLRGNISKLEEIVGLLIEGGADVNIADEDGVTPLHIATNKGMTRSVKQLLRGRADPNKKNKKGYTALLSAFANDHID
ncbi:hypothetical protein CAPTEDRAFT_56974, partial [Capitella teleta]